MKLLVGVAVGVAVLCLVASSQADQVGIFDNREVTRAAFAKLKKFFSVVTETMDQRVHAHRQRRQSQNCFRDIQETNGEHFMQCNQLIEALNDGTNITHTSTVRFCQSHCPYYMIDLAERLSRDCDFPDSLDAPTKKYINQSCDMGPNHEFCIFIWSNITTSLGSNTSTAAITYNKCISENTIDDSKCNVDCKPAEQWIISNVGCCYKAIVNYYRYIGVSTGLLTDDEWDICNMKEPDECISPRK